MRHVSSSPSKIPYGGFSPVRLQTGYQPWRPSSTLRSALDVRHAFSRAARPTYTPLPLFRWCPMVLSDKMSGPLLRGLQSSGPWLASGLCCPTRSSLTMAASESLGLSRRFMDSYDGSFPVSLIQGRPERFPNLLCLSFPPCRPPYPVGPGRCS